MPAGVAVPGPLGAVSPRCCPTDEPVIVFGLMIGRTNAVFLFIILADFDTDGSLSFLISVPMRSESGSDYFRLYKFFIKMMQNVMGS